GGCVGGRWVEVLGTPTFVPGEPVLVFLQRTRDGGLRTTALALGVYHVRDGAGGPQALRAAPLADERPLAALAGTIRALAAAEPPADDVDATPPAGGRSERFTFL